MNDHEQRSERERDDANRDYFLTLGYARFSLDRLSGMSFVAHLSLIGVALLLCAVAAITSVTFRFQVFFTGAMALLAALGWVYAICFTMLSTASMVSGPPGSAVFSLPRLTVIGVGGTVVVLMASVVHVCSGSSWGWSCSASPPARQPLSPRIGMPID